MDGPSPEAILAIELLERALDAEGSSQRAGPAPEGLSESHWVDLIRLLAQDRPLAAELRAFTANQGPWPKALVIHSPELTLWMAKRHRGAKAYMPDAKRFVAPQLKARAHQRMPQPKSFQAGPIGQLRLGALALEILGGKAKISAGLEAWRKDHAQRSGRLPVPIQALPLGAWKENEVEWHWAGRAIAQLPFEANSVAVLAPPHRDLEELPGGVPGIGPGDRPMLWRPQEESKALCLAGWWVLSPHKLLVAWLEGLALKGHLPSDLHLFRSDRLWMEEAPKPEPNAKGEVANGWLQGPTISPLDLRRRALEHALWRTGVAMDDRVALFGLGWAPPPGPHPDFLAEEALRTGPFDLRLRRMLLKHSMGPGRWNDPAWEAWRLVPHLAWRKLAPLALARQGVLEVAAPHPETWMALQEQLSPKIHGLWENPISGAHRQSLRASISLALQGLQPPLLWVPAEWRWRLAPLLEGLLEGLLLVADEDLPPGVRFVVVADWRWKG